MDVAGTFVKGWDYGMAKEAKYALVATIPVPVGSRLADPKTSPCSETEAAMWLVDRALYGLQTSPSDWGCVSRW